MMMHQDRRCRSRRPQLRPHKVRCCPRASRRRCRTNARVLARTNPVSAPRAVPACSYDGLGQPPSLPSSKVVLALGFPCSKKGTKVQKCTRSCRLSSLIQVSACRLLLSIPLGLSRAKNWREKLFLGLVQIEINLCALLSFCTKPRKSFSRQIFS